MSSGEMRIGRGRLDDKHEKFVVEESRTVTDVSLVQHVLSALKDGKNFGGAKYRCFSPGMSIDYLDGEQQVHHQVCLRCLWVKTFVGGVAKEMRPLCKHGGKEFMAIYVGQFGESKKGSE